MWPWRDFWRGRVSLGTAFWWFYIATGMGIFLLLVLVSAAFGLIGLAHPALAMSFAAYILYELWAAVGVWRSASADPRRNRLLPWLAKGWVAFMSIGTIIHLINGGALAIMELVTS